MQHNGPIRKFVFDFKFERDISISNAPNSRKFDFDQWFLFITRKGVEEMNITFPTTTIATYEINKYFRLPNCIFSCLTLKRLHLSGVLVAPTINASCIFPNVTELSFDEVVFGTIKLDCVIDVPMLETLSFSYCENASYFNIKAPRLDRLTLNDYEIEDDIEVYRVLPVNLDLWQRELNMECLELSSVKFHDDYEFSSFIHSLRICPKLRKLDIMSLWFDARISDSILWDGLQSVAKVHKMFNTFKLRLFNGWRSELQFIKMLLAHFSALEKVVIIRRADLDSHDQFEVMQKLLHFPRASKKAKIIYI
ncbi:F-box/FBD/LRR-repeat protein At1g13570-like [Ipomoea triloba]|uniref:F-box/FBD/LRR-repeat protein At1g13570-like n=1 Tax=Ipomoea triloba TaxID=35885 RepID=UPI00125E68EC|nr:F-box/FBD/LRR-repeat protein At1g13570-like [Ipomoea triloba]